MKGHGAGTSSRPIKSDDLHRIVSENDKLRFTLSDDGMRIRAAQGHSVAINLDLQPLRPPEELFHCTASAALDVIYSEGITPQRRQHVHLSTDPQTAARVGKRHGRPVVLTIDAGKMHSEGHVFWQADNGVWLTDHVAPAYLGFNAPASARDGPDDLSP